MTLLRSYSSGLDDLRPTLQLALDEGVELLRGATNDLGGSDPDERVAHKADEWHGNSSQTQHSP
jgi:hypothetical protein